MSVQILKSDVFLHKASHLYFTPWVKNGSVLEPGTTTYDIVDILADTIAIEQGDPETETIDWEFGDSPLMSTSTKGERTVAASCIDLSVDILNFVFDWERKTYTSGNDTLDAMVFEKDGTTELYATIVVTFHGDKAPVIVLPKVSMNSKTTIGTLKTSTAQADLSGVAQAAYIEYGNSSSGPLATPVYGTTEMAVLLPISGEKISCALSSAQSDVTIGTINLAASTNEVSLV